MLASPLLSSLLFPILLHSLSLLFSFLFLSPPSLFHRRHLRVMACLRLVQHEQRSPNSLKKDMFPRAIFFFFFFTFLPHIAGDIWHSAPCLQCLCHCNCHLVLYRQRCFHSKLPARISTPDKSPSTSRPDISPRVGQLTGDNDYL